MILPSGFTRRRSEREFRLTVRFVRCGFPDRVFDFPSGIAQPELALDPDGQAENVAEAQKAIEEDAAPVFVPEQSTPGDEETQLAHERKRQRQKNHYCDKDCVASTATPISRQSLLRGKNGEAAGGGEQPLRKGAVRQNGASSSAGPASNWSSGGPVRRGRASGSSQPALPTRGASRSGGSCRHTRGSAARLRRAGACPCSSCRQTRRA